MPADMPITAIAPWFGGKRNLAPLIVRELGDHRAYWEPFCGSLAVLFAKEPSSQETVNDLHGHGGPAAEWTVLHLRHRRAVSMKTGQQKRMWFGK